MDIDYKEAFRLLSEKIKAECKIAQGVVEEECKENGPLKYTILKDDIKKLKPWDFEDTITIFGQMHEHAGEYSILKKLNFMVDDLASGEYFKREKEWKDFIENCFLDEEDE